MSDHEPISVNTTAEEARAILKKMRMDNLARARTTKILNAREREAVVRTAQMRTREDAANVGIVAHPGPAERATVSREEQPDQPIRRLRRSERQLDAFSLPPHMKKPGWSYEWKTTKVLNEPIDSSAMIDVREAGWRPEKACNWPGLVEPGTPDDSAVERLGQRLYGRPMSLTLEARQDDLEYAQAQQRDRTLAARSGQSAVRGEDGIPNGRGIRPVPVSLEIEGLIG